MTSALSSISGATPGQSPQRAQLEMAAQAFEAVFARQMIGSMRSPSLGEDLFGSDAGDQFRDMQDSKLAENMASSGSLGIAQMLLKQFEGVVPASDKGITK